MEKKPDISNSECNLLCILPETTYIQVIIGVLVSYKLPGF